MGFLLSLIVACIGNIKTGHPANIYVIPYSLALSITAPTVLLPISTYIDRYNFEAQKNGIIDREERIAYARKRGIPWGLGQALAFYFPFIIGAFRRKNPTPKKDDSDTEPPFSTSKDPINKLDKDIKPNTGSRTNASEAKIEYITQFHAEKIVQEFGKFLAERSPIIKDSSLLPHPKSLIMKALYLQEKQACDIANQHVNSTNTKVPKNLESYIESLGGCRIQLCQYTHIDEQEKEIVSELNQYKSARSLPDELREKCMQLTSKYTSKGMEEEIPGWNKTISSITDKNT